MHGPDILYQGSLKNNDPSDLLSDNIKAAMYFHAWKWKSKYGIIKRCLQNHIFYFVLSFFFPEILTTVECQSFLLIFQQMLLTEFGWIGEKRRFPLRWSGVCCHKATEDLDSAGLGKNLHANNWSCSHLAICWDKHLHVTFYTNLSGKQENLYMRIKLRYYKWHLQID